MPILLHKKQKDSLQWRIEQWNRFATLRNFFNNDVFAWLSNKTLRNWEDGGWTVGRVTEDGIVYKAIVFYEGKET